MKLSEAIREGAKVTAPGFSDLVVREGDTVRACALGCSLVTLMGTAAALELNALHPEAGYEKLTEAWPELNAGIPREGYLKFAIWWKNDNRQMTREEIADWVESLGY